jgi:hypothetical protein
MDNFNISKDDDCVYQIETKSNDDYKPRAAILNKSLSPTKKFINELGKIILKMRFKFLFEKKQEISRLLELSKNVKITESEFEAIIENNYIREFDEKSLIIINDLSENDTFLKLLFTLMIQRPEITTTFMINILSDIITIINNNHIDNSDLFKRVLSCLIMIDDEKKLSNKMLYKIIPLFFETSINDTLIGGNESLLNLIVNYLKEKHSNILNGILEDILAFINENDTITKENKKIIETIINSKKIKKTGHTLSHFYLKHFQ